MTSAPNPPSASLPRLEGRTVVVSGASSGIGAAAARRFAAAGATVVPLGRDPQRTRALAAELGVEPVLADFTRLDDVRRAAAEVLERCERIDVLANNAGGTFPQRVTTVDGHEKTFQVNHLATFLLTALLRERVEATPGARVVTTSSRANGFGRVDLDDLDSTAGRYRSFKVYGTTKLENILFTRELSRRLGGTATASCFHPGVVGTAFGADSPVVRALYSPPLSRVFTITSEEGAAPLLALATRPDPETVDGAYLDRFAPGRPNRQADDVALARGLWERSAAMVGVPRLTPVEPDLHDPREPLGPRAVRAVVFDLDATLVDHVGAATAGLRAWLAARGAEASDPLVARWFALEEEHFTRWRDGEISHDEQRRERLRAFLPLVGARVGAPAELDAEFAGFLAEFRRHWRAFDDALDVLAALHAGSVVTAVLTNGVEELQRDKLEHLGLADAVGPLFAADALGVAKPRPGAFTAVCDRLGLEPREVLYVGDDHAVDVLGARAAGLRAVLVDRTGSAPPEERCVVTSLAQVLELPAVRAALAAG